MNQLAIKDWPKGLTWELAKLDLEPEALEDLGIKFSESSDDLDSFKAAIISAPWGNPYALERYAHCPVPGITIIGMEAITDGNDELQRILMHLNISPSRLTWRNPNIE